MKYRARWLIVLSLLALPAPGSAKSLSGTWSLDLPGHAGKWLKTIETAGHVRFQLELSKGDPSYDSGFIEGEFEVDHDVGVFRSMDGPDSNKGCEITFVFSPGNVKVRQTPADGCGFGYGVYADGVLRRTSSRIPRFSKGDPRD